MIITFTLHSLIVSDINLDYIYEVSLYCECVCVID